MRVITIPGISCASALGAVLLFAGVARADKDASAVEEIVITSERVEDDLQSERSLTPGGVTLVDGADLHRRSVTNMADMLRYVPGVWAESGWGSDELFYSSRGSNLDATDFDKNGVKLFQDGLPVTTADGNNHNRVLDPLSERYAVVARGANALTYGASTLGGAFDFVSPTARTTEPLALHLNVGSSGLFSRRLTAGGVLGDFDGLVTVEAKSRDGYRDHSRQDRKGLYANAGWQMSETLSTRVYATFIENDEELPRALSRAQIEEDPDQVVQSAITGDNRKILDTSRFAFKTTWEIGPTSSLQFGVSHEDQSLYHPIVDVRGDDPDGDGPLLGVQFFSLLIDTDHRNLGGMVRYSTQLGDHDVLLGLNYGDTEVRGGNFQNLFGRRNGLSQRVHDQAESLEAFIIDRWRIAEALTLVYGAQVVDTSRDVRVIEASDGSLRNPRGDYSSVNPRLGLIYELGDSIEAFASVSRLFEAPTTFELEDDRRGTDELLDAMQGTVFELGVRGSAATAVGVWQWDIAAYYSRIRDEILSVEDPSAPGTSLTTNVDSTIHAGVEALVGGSFPFAGDAHRLEPLVSITLNEFSFDSDAEYGNNDLPAAPKYAVRGELMYHHESGFYMGPTFDFIGKRYGDFANTYSVDSHRVLGLRAGYVAGSWELFGELRNLTDEDYISTVSVRDRADEDDEILFPGAPLSAYLGVRITMK